MPPSKDFPRVCGNCRTDRYKVRARGYCARCYPLILKREVISNWNINDPDSLKYYPYGHDPHLFFKVIKKGFIAQIERRLAFLRHRESQRVNGADGIDIEFMLRNLARRVGARGDVLFGVANHIDHTFPPEQKKVLFQLLNDIEEKIPWIGLSVVQALDEYGPWADFANERPQSSDRSSW